MEPLGVQHLLGLTKLPLQPRFSLAALGVLVLRQVLAVQ
jgi:hypothetical protein